MRLIKPKTLKYAIAMLSFLSLAAAIFISYHDLVSYQPANLALTPAGNTVADNPAQHQHESASADGTASAADMSEKQTIDLKQQQADLSKKIETIQSNIKALQAASSTQNSSPPAQEEVEPAPDPVPESPEAEEESVNAELIAQMGLLDDTLETEAPDPEWSTEATSALKAKASQNQDIQVNVLDVTCRSSLCRMEIAFQPGEHENSFRHLQELVPWSGEMFFQVDDVNNGEAVIYIARENHSLPKISE
jgi:hypothetical protein